MLERARCEGLAEHTPEGLAWRNSEPSGPGHHIQTGLREDDTSPEFHQQYVHISCASHTRFSLADNDFGRLQQEREQE